MNGCGDFQVCERWPATGGILSRRPLRLEAARPRALWQRCQSMSDVDVAVKYRSTAWMRGRESTGVLVSRINTRTALSRHRRSVCLLMQNANAFVRFHRGCRVLQM